MAEIIGYQTWDDHRAGGRNNDNVIGDYRKHIPSNGWVTSLAVHAGGSDATTHAQLCLWQYDDGKLLFASPQQTWVPGREWKSASVPGGVRVEDGSRIRMGFWRHPEEPAEWGTRSIDEEHARMNYTAQIAPPDPFNPYAHFQGALAGYITFVRNEAPLKGVWRDPTPLGPTADTAPELSGTLPHVGFGVTAVLAGHVHVDTGTQEVDVRWDDPQRPNLGYALEVDVDAARGPGGIYEEVYSDHIYVSAREATVRIGTQGEELGLDYSTRVQVEIYNTTTGVTVTPAFEPTAEENAQGYFMRSVYTFTPGQTYIVRYRHQDSWGLWSAWSDYTVLLILDAAGAPTNPSPITKLNSGTGFNYTATHNHPRSLNANAAQVQVYNETGQSLLYDSGAITQTPNVAPGGTLTVPSTFHGTLLSGRKYRWRIRARDTSFVFPWGAWSSKFQFSINAPPYAPTNLRPSGGIASADATLKANVSDPDGDLLTQVQVEVYRVSDNVLLAGYPKNMSLSTDGRMASLDVTGDLTLGTAYKWRVRSYDGTVWGDWSGFAQFTFAQVPTVTLRSPREGGITQLVPQSGAEYDPGVVGAWWTEVGRDASNFIDRVLDGDAAYGVGSWKATTAGNAAHYYLSGFMSVEGTRHYVTAVRAKTIVGNPASRFRVACYNSGGTLLGYVVPASLGALDGTTPDTTWEDYGGEIWGSGSAETIRFPVGTTQIRYEFYPSVTAGASGEVRFDAFQSYQADSLSASEFLKAQPFWGFMNGDTETYGLVDDRVWEGVPGNSTSRGPNVLNGPSAYVEITYASQQGSPKSDDRLVIEQWSGTAWVTTLANSYASNGSRTTIPIPSGSVRNQGRYRVTVYVKDSQTPTALEGASIPVEFDVTYDGPPELIVSQISGNALAATITMNHARSTLDPLEFGGIEYQVIPRGENAITYFSGLIEAEAFTYHFPLSGREYTIRMRQIQIVGSEQIESRWTEATGQVDYFPLFFLKSVIDPAGLNVGFHVLAEALPASKDTRQVKAYVPFDGDRPTFGVGPARHDTGNITIHLFEDPMVGPETGEEKLAKVKRIFAAMPTLCLLSHKPSLKRFVQVTEGPGHTLRDGSFDYVVNLIWSEAFFLEDAYERGDNL